MWLEAPVEEIDERGRHHRTTRNKDEGRGSPQGSPLSPLLANVYMRRFVRGWKTLGHERRLNAVIVNYADDFVICCRGTADEAMAAMRGMMSRLKLTVNETKTRLCRVPEETFDFLGYTIGRCYSPRTGRSYIGTRPSAKKVASLRDEIRELTDRRWQGTSVEDRVARLNRLLLGWSNYFCLGPVSRCTVPSTGTVATGSASGCAGSTRSKAGGRHGSPTSTCTMCWDWSTWVRGRGASRGRKRESLSESRMREIRPSGSMSGEWKRGMARLLRHRRPKGPGTDRPSLNHRATPRLYLTASFVLPSLYLSSMIGISADRGIGSDPRSDHRQPVDVGGVVPLCSHVHLTAKWDFWSGVLLGPSGRTLIRTPACLTSKKSVFGRAPG